MYSRITKLLNLEKIPCMLHSNENNMQGLNHADEDNTCCFTLLKIKFNLKKSLNIFTVKCHLSMKQIKIV